MRRELNAGEGKNGRKGAGRGEVKGQLHSTCEQSQEKARKKHQEGEEISRMNDFKKGTWAGQSS